MKLNKKCQDIACKFRPVPSHSTHFKVEFLIFRICGYTKFSWCFRRSKMFGSNSILQLKLRCLILWFELPNRFQMCCKTEKRKEATKFPMWTKSFRSYGNGWKFIVFDSSFVGGLFIHFFLFCSVLLSYSRPFAYVYFRRQSNDVCQNDSSMLF